MVQKDATVRNIRKQEDEPESGADGLVASSFGENLKGARVSIQGYEGSFHQEAARVFFGKNVQVITCDNFRDVVKIASNKKESNGGVMAIENSIAGSILPNYNLLQKSNLKNRKKIKRTNRIQYPQNLKFFLCQMNYFLD